MNRKDVRQIAARLNNPILLLALERHTYHGVSWEDAINRAVVELAKQNDFFLQMLVDSKLKSDPHAAPAPPLVRPGTGKTAVTNPAAISETTDTHPPTAPLTSKIA